MADLDTIAAENAAKPAAKAEENVRKGNAKMEALEKQLEQARSQLNPKANPEQAQHQRNERKNEWISTTGKKSENTINGRLFPKKRMEKRVDLTTGDIRLTSGFNDWRYRINEWI